MQDYLGRGSTEPHVVLMVFTDGTIRISATTHCDNAFRQWRRRYGDFMPVAVFAGDPAAFMRLFDIHRLPVTESTLWAAERFKRAPVDMAAQPAVWRHIRHIGHDKAASILAEWAKAVQEVKE